MHDSSARPMERGSTDREQQARGPAKDPTGCGYVTRSMSDTATGSNEKRPSRSRWRSWIEWGLIVAFLLFLQFTPQGKQLLGLMQRGILATGLITPDIAFAEKNDVPASWDVHLESLDGESFSLEAYRGKVVFMNLWATWCAPCIAEMPYIQNLYEDVASEDIVFVMISVDESREAARQFVQRRGFTFPVYFPMGGLPEPYSTRTIPTTYVISADGQLATVHTGMAKVDTPEFKSFLRSLVRGDERL
ncbi:MAG: redoxin family protein [Rhodothermales bacterium]|nr:redoxin family protein [Rhodothermales bacterium]